MWRVSGIKLRGSHALVTFRQFLVGLSIPPSHGRPWPPGFDHPSAPTLRDALVKGCGVVDSAVSAAFFDVS